MYTQYQYEKRWQGKDMKGKVDHCNANATESSHSGVTHSFQTKQFTQCLTDYRIPNWNPGFLALGSTVMKFNENQSRKRHPDSFWEGERMAVRGRHNVGFDSDFWWRHFCFWSRDADVACLPLWFFLMDCLIGSYTLLGDFRRMHWRIEPIRSSYSVSAPLAIRRSTSLSSETDRQFQGVEAKNILILQVGLHTFLLRKVKDSVIVHVLWYVCCRFIVFQHLFKWEGFKRYPVSHEMLAHGFYPM